MSKNNTPAQTILPPSIQESTVLTQQDKALLAGVDDIPPIDPSYDDDVLKNIIQYYSISPNEMEKELHIHAKTLLAQHKVQAAWQVLLTGV